MPYYLTTFTFKIILGNPLTFYRKESVRAKPLRIDSQREIDMVPVSCTPIIEILPVPLYEKDHFRETYNRPVTAKKI